MLDLTLSNIINLNYKGTALCSQSGMGNRTTPLNKMCIKTAPYLH